MDPVEIMNELRACEDEFPEELLREVSRRPAEMTPHLLAVLEEAAADVAAIDVGYELHVYAMYLLAQFREPRAYPVMIRFFSAPGPDIEAAVGNLLVEDLGRMLVAVSGGDLGPIKAMAENEAVYDYVRASALEALVVAVSVGIAPREEMVKYFHGLFAGGLERKLSFAWAGLVLACVDLHPGDWMEQIEQAYKDGLVEEKVFPLAEVRELNRLGVEDVMIDLRSDLQLISDGVSEAATWAGWQIDDSDPADWDEAEGADDELSAQPSESKVGRNDPCPCGSQKKYKKCCG